MAACVALSCALGWAADAGAQEKERGQSVALDAQRAESLISRGIARRRSGEDAQALELFQQAEQLSPDSVRLQVHLAATHQALGQWEAADRYLTRALDNPTHRYVKKHEGVLAAARRKIDSQIGSLRLHGSPKGAEIRLNGRLVGTLPMDQPIRVQAGIYTLEARLPGHYPVTRSVALAGGALVRESLELSPKGDAAGGAMGGGAATPEDVGPGRASSAGWPTWAFSGLALVSGVVTVGAWATREQHADVWNDDSRCLSPGMTREEACGSELRDGERAETWMLVGAASTATFATAAIVSYLLRDTKEEAAVGSLSCGFGLAQLSCAGRF